MRDIHDEATPGPQIEDLLVAGLDRYFAGRHEEAIHIWTRVLFIDRGHQRARAYIERARLALAERQHGDEPAVLALNNEHAAELSLLDATRLSHLLRESFHARIIGPADAFMIAFDEGADYDSPNFVWFRERYPRFAYVDRIAVAPRARGRGLARTLYEDMFAQATKAGHTVVVCEVNSEPPNPASDAFHAALGFREVGQATIHGGAKSVRYFERPLT